VIYEVEKGKRGKPLPLLWEIETSDWSIYLASTLIKIKWGLWSLQTFPPMAILLWFKH